MKKLIATIAALLMCFGILTGCTTTIIPTIPGGEQGGGEGDASLTPLETIGQKYEKITEAKLIVQTIDIVNGQVTQYESEKSYTRRGSGYAVEGTVKKLNDLSAETPYTETTVSDTVKAGEFVPKIEFDELYFSASKVENGTLEAVVSDNSVETVFGISEDLPAPVHDLSLKVATNDKHVTRIDISYASSDSTVVIALTFTY